MELAPEGKQLVKDALTAKAWSLEKLAEQSGIGIATVKKFHSGQSVNRATCVTLCETLGIDWYFASGQIREQCRQKILNQHSRMRLLSGEEIGVDQLYVDVWLLNRSPRTFQVSQDKLLQAFDLRNDRLGLGDRIRRKRGFEVAQAHAKLLILGKPGAGKTTFLKHLAVNWCSSEFQSDLIAILIELRQIRDQQWGLQNALERELEPLEQQQVETLLRQGNLLILMDGLDEISTKELRRNVQGQLLQFAEKYPNNRFILTCRTQIIESIPVGFTSVEVADFDAEQVKQFVENWFKASCQSSAEAEQPWTKFNTIVDRNPALRELTVTPVLLSLMCLVFHDEGEIPSDIAGLYQRGIKLLLSKWNNTKPIDGWEVGSETYRQLSVKQKEALLIEIAARKFENPENFVLFKQKEIAAQITKFLQLPHSQEGIAVLRAIEAQHGLLIERADELWSFSHLTFQEHFTVQWLTQLPTEQLAATISNQPWQEVIKQLVKSQQPADRLLRLIKQAIDLLIANQAELQRFLIWVLQKSESIQADYKRVAIRAFYFAHAHTFAYDLALDLAYARALALDLDHDLALARALALDLDRDLALVYNLDLAYDLARTHARARALTLGRALALDCALNLDRARARALTLDLDLAHALVRALALALDLARALDLAHARTLALDLARTLDLALDLARTLALTRYPEIAKQLEQLRATLSLVSLENWHNFQQWWQANGSQWTEQLRQVMIEHRNIGHDWQFDQTQKQQLQRYYDANKFLVELMKIQRAVSDHVRTELEDTLLLPMEELQHRQPGIYGKGNHE